MSAGLEGVMRRGAALARGGVAGVVLRLAVAWRTARPDAVQTITPDSLTLHGRGLVDRWIGDADLRRGRVRP